MKFTVNRCATEGIEETFDRYEYLMRKDPSVLNANKRVRDMIGCIRDVLANGQDPAEALSLLDELDNAYVDLDTEKLKVLAETGWNDVQVAYELGREYFLLEKRRDRLRQEDPDERRPE